MRNDINRWNDEKIEASWEKMHVLLDKEMPEKRRRLAFWLLPLLGLVLVSTVSVLWFYKPSESVNALKDTKIVAPPIDSSPSSKTTKNDLVQANEGSVTKETMPSSKVNIQDTKKDHSVTGIKKTTPQSITTSSNQTSNTDFNTIPSREILPNPARSNLIHANPDSKQQIRPFIDALDILASLPSISLNRKQDFMPILALEPNYYAIPITPNSKKTKGAFYLGVGYRYAPNLFQEASLFLGYKKPLFKRFGLDISVSGGRQYQLVDTIAYSTLVLSQAEFGLPSLDNETIRESNKNSSSTSMTYSIGMSANINYKLGKAVSLDFGYQYNKLITNPLTFSRIEDDYAVLDMNTYSYMVLPKDQHWFVAGVNAKLTNRFGLQAQYHYLLSPYYELSSNDQHAVLQNDDKHWALSLRLNYQF